MKVPIFDGARTVAAQKDELVAAAERVIASGRYILGPEVDALENEVAERLGVDHAIGVASGTDALTIALRAAGVGPGARVLTSPFTFFATVSSIVSIGAEPVFADIDPVTMNLDPDAVGAALAGHAPTLQRRRIDPATIRAVVPVHIFGGAADLDTIGAHARIAGIPVIEDAAQAFGTVRRGTSAGALGNAGAFSFFPTKNLGGFGDGGLITTDDASLAACARLFRVHGSSERYRHEALGTNSRLDALQAALLRVRLGSVDEALAARRSHASAYAAAWSGLDLILPHESAETVHSYHQFVVRLLRQDRDEIRSKLAAAGIETAIHYPIPAHLQPALVDLGYGPGDFPEAEEASRTCMSVPMYPELATEELDYVITTMRRLLERTPLTSTVGG